MKITSDGADKLIKQLEKDRQTLLNEIRDRSTYIVAVSEDVEALRPDFNFNDVVEKIEKIENRILEIKHARNEFNNSTVLSTLGLTIDKALVRMSMINKQVGIFDSLSNRMPRQRERDVYGRSNQIEYSYINYEIADAKSKLDSLTNELTEIKKELNLANSTLTFEISDI